MKIEAPHAGWSEQNPEIWWINLVKATRKLFFPFKVNPAHEK